MIKCIKTCESVDIRSNKAWALVKTGDIFLNYSTCFLHKGGCRIECYRITWFKGMSWTFEKSNFVNISEVRNKKIKTILK